MTAVITATACSSVRAGAKTFSRSSTGYDMDARISRRLSRKLDIYRNFTKKLMDVSSKPSVLSATFFFDGLLLNKVYPIASPAMTATTATTVLWLGFINFRRGSTTLLISNAKKTALFWTVF